MKIFLPVWGDQYIDWAKRGLLKSLCWKKNAAALRGAEFLIATDKPEAFTEPTLFPQETTQSFIPPHKTELMRKEFADYALPIAIEKCLAVKEPMLLATADYVFADGSIDSLKEFGTYPGVCVSAAHVRVHPNILTTLPDNCTSQQLVDLAWYDGHLHSSWANSNCKKGRNNSYAGGVSWRALGSLIFVQHRLPTAFMVNFITSDLDYFKREPFNSWDWNWPETWTERMRYLGSSDAAFIVEITLPTLNNPAIRDTNQEEPDWFHIHKSHMGINRQFVSVFRR